MRILIEGTALAGRTTVAEVTAAALRAEGLPVRLIVGCGASPTLARWMAAAEARLAPGSLLRLWLVVAGLVLDLARRAPPPEEDEVILTVAYGAEAAAVASAFGHGLTARVLTALARRAHPCDLRVGVTASHLERVRRYLRRPANTPMDRLVLSDPLRLLEIERIHGDAMTAAGVAVLCTDGLVATEAAALVLAHLVELAQRAVQSAPALRPAPRLRPVPADPAPVLAAVVRAA